MSEKITDHIDEDKAANILSDFYKAYRNREYGLYEMLAFSFEQGWVGHINEMAKERNNGIIQEVK